MLPYRRSRNLPETPLARGDDHEKDLKQALRTLDAAAASDRLETIKAAIRAASAGHSIEF